MAKLKYITPFRRKLDHCLSIGNAPSQGLVYALDTNIVLKLPFQYLITDDLDTEAEFYLNHALRGLVAMEKERAVYDAVARRPHTNIARRLEVDSSTCLFLERLKPLGEIWIDSDETIRHRWVRQLLDGVCWLEGLGYTHGDLSIRNLGVDSFNCLKLLDFGSATSYDHFDYMADVKRDHSGLATCLHFILTGIDPFANVHSALEVRKIENQLLVGCGIVESGAEILADIIQAGWTEQAASHKFFEVKKRVEAIIGAVDLGNTSETSEERYRRLESRCAEWLKGTATDERWMDPEDYCAAWRAKGFEAEMDIWR